MLTKSTLQKIKDAYVGKNGNCLLYTSRGTMAKLGILFGAQRGEKLPNLSGTPPKKDTDFM